MSEAVNCGREVRIASGAYEASIMTIGASLREVRYTAEGAEPRDLVRSFPTDQRRLEHRGSTLAPWPNRIMNARYTFEGVEHQLPVSEPARGNAIHGLVDWTDFEVRVQEADRVVFGTVIEPQTGYPFRVEVEVEYAVAADGLTSIIRGRNLGDDTAPWGSSTHPYLVAGAGRADEWTLHFDAAQVLLATGEQMIPDGPYPVTEHPEFDFRQARLVGDTPIDNAFTGLARTDGWFTAAIRTADGTGVALAMDSEFGWAQAYTADGSPDPDNRRGSIAIEPMTCPPDAYNSGTDLVSLAAGAEHEATWRLYAL